MVNSSDPTPAHGRQSEPAGPKLFGWLRSLISEARQASHGDDRPKPPDPNGPRPYCVMRRPGHDQPGITRRREDPDVDGDPPWI